MAQANVIPPPVTPERALLESLFLTMSQFAYDKAKEQLDKEKETHKNTVSKTWVVVLGTLSNLVGNEKAYFSLLHPQTRGFLKNYNLRRSYNAVRTDLRRIVDQCRSRMSLLQQTSPESSLDEAGGSVAGPRSEELTSASFDRLLAHLCGQLADYVTARMSMVDLYGRMAAMGANTAIDYRELCSGIENVIVAHQRDFHHPILSPLKSSLAYEWEILRHLLHAHVEIQNVQFLPSLLHLHDAHSKLTSWRPVVPAVKETGSMWGNLLSWGSASSSGSHRHEATPALYQWIVSFKQAAIAKFTLYFYDVLSKQTTLSEMKALAAKTSVDFSHKVASFQRKNEIVSVNLMLDIQRLDHDKPYNGPGYQHPDKLGSAPSLSGQSTTNYPALFSWPQPPVTGSGYLPTDRPTAAAQQHWPTLITIINDNSGDLALPAKIATVYIPALDYTYFVTRVDPAVYFVVICHDKRSERDTHITSFVEEITSHLRMYKLFTQLKPGTK